MKRIAQILIAAVVLFSSGIAAAANWQWINSDDKVGYFFDTETIHYELEKDPLLNGWIPNRNKVTCWVKIVYTQEAANNLVKNFQYDRLYSLASSLQLETFYLTENAISLHQAIYYDHNGSVIYSEDYDSPSLFGSTSAPEKVIPETWGEVTLNAIRDYTNTHHFDLLSNSAPKQKRSSIF